MIERLPIAEPAQTRRAARRLFTEDRWSVLLVLALNSLAALAGLVAPWLLGRIVDQVGSGTAQMSTVDIMAAVILACAAAQLLLSRFARYYGHRFGERALAGTREEFVGDALSLPARVLERTGTGDLMTRGSADVAAIGTSLREAMPTLFVASLQVLFVFGALFALSPLLALCALVAVPPAIMISRWYLRRARPAYLQEGQADSEMSETLSELAEGARTVEAYGLEAAQLSAVDDRVELSRTARLRTLFLRNVFFPVVDLITSLPLLVIVLAGGYFISEDLLTLGVVVSGVLYAWQVMEPFDLIIDWLEQLQRSSAAFARIKGVGRAVPDQVASGAVPVDDRLVISELHYAYNDGKDVLHGVDLTVRPGEQLALVGPSGAGKSTLGRLLAGIDVPRQGSVTVGGVPVAELSPEVLRERVVLVTQEHHVFLGTVRDNLLIAAPDADDATLLNALDVVDAAWVSELPEGLDTMLGPDHLQPDAPQAQQLALARVVLADPHTVVLDEATALLDPRTARHVERAVAAVLAGRTVVAIAHRLQTARDSDRIAVVDHGRITELGTHDELITANGAYATLWRSWQDA